MLTIQQIRRKLIKFWRRYNVNLFAFAFSHICFEVYLFFVTLYKIIIIWPQSILKSIFNNNCISEKHLSNSKPTGFPDGKLLIRRYQKSYNWLSMIKYTTACFYQKGYRTLKMHRILSHPDMI